MTIHWKAVEDGTIIFPIQPFLGEKLPVICFIGQLAIYQSNEHKNNFFEE
jgi:hypothetical protein